MKKVKKQGKDLNELFKVIEVLANGYKLDKNYNDHSLSVEYKDTRECHIEPDWLLIYEMIDEVLVLTLIRTGSHSELF